MNLSKSQKNILSLIWCLPAVVLVFSMMSALMREKSHFIVYIKVFFVCLGFVAIAGFFYRRYRNIGISLFVGLSLIVLFGVLPVVFRFVYWVLIVLVLLIELKTFYLNYSWVHWKKFSFSAFILALVVLPFFGMEYSQPNSLVKLVKSHIHLDTLYHIAVASMWKVHHTISHGLHGVGILNYHFGSHFLMASAGSLAGFSVFESYSHFFGLFCITLLGISAIAIAEEYYPSDTDSGFFSKLLSYGFIILGSSVISSDSIFTKFALWPSFYESESYVVSLILFFSFFSVLRKDAISSEYIRGIFIVAILGFMTISKLSTGFCALALLGSWALISEEKIFTKKWTLHWLIFFLSSVVFLFLFQVINPSKGDVGWKPFQFVSAYALHFEPFWLRYAVFVLVHFFFVFVAIIFFIFNLKNYLVRNAFPLWWMLGCVLSFFAGLGVVTLFYVEGGSGYYFSNVSMFMAMPLLLCAYNFIDLKFSNITKKIVISLIVLITLINAPRTIWEKSKVFLAEIRQKQISTTLSAYIEQLQQIRIEPAGKNALVYIPRSERDFWGSTDCRKLGFIIPAVSERPALYGWPSNECYGFLCGPRFHSNGLCEKSKGVFTDEELLTETKRLGFNRVYVVTSKETRILQ